MNKFVLIICLILTLILIFFKITENYSNSKKKNIITFIIPTIGRKTLKNTISSLINQTDGEWKAIIIFDGVNINIKKVLDNRIKIIKLNKKKGIRNNAGYVRNIAIKMIKRGWIGFIDDDDIISINYVKNLKNDILKYPKVKTIIFRMLNSDNRILPLPKQKNFYEGDVGISFAVKVSIIKKYKLYFNSNDIEDYDLLNRIREKKIKMLISSHLNYFVKKSKIVKKISNKKFNEVLIN